MAKCRARTVDGTPCQIKVSWPGQRCRFHKGDPSVEQHREQVKGRGSKRRSRRSRKSVALVRRRIVHGLKVWKRSQERDQGVRARKQAAQAKAVEQAAQEWSATLQRDGLIAAIQDRAIEYVSDRTWRRIVADWHGRHCVSLARIARSILEAKSMIHGALAALVTQG